MKFKFFGKAKDYEGSIRTVLQEDKVVYIINKLCSQTESLEKHISSIGAGLTKLNEDKDRCVVELKEHKRILEAVYEQNVALVEKLREYERK